MTEELKENIEFYTPTEEEFEQWRTAGMSVWAKVADSIDADILARVQSLQ